MCIRDRHYCENAAEAAELIKAMIPEGSKVSWGGSLTLDQIGIKDMLKAGNYDVNDPMAPGCLLYTSRCV